MGLLAVLLIYGLIEGLCYVGLLLVGYTTNFRSNIIISRLSENQKASLRRFIRTEKGRRVPQDPVLGWIETAETNAAGMRDDRMYAPEPPAGKVRLAAFGDSFVYGADVALRDSWAKQLAGRDSTLEVLNYGSRGYGLDQAYLRYLRQGRDYMPHIVFIGYMSENIARNVVVYRAFYHSGYRNTISTKPRYKVVADTLVLLENPIATIEDHERFLLNDTAVLAELGVNDYHYQMGYKTGPFDILPSVRFVKVFVHALNTRLIHPIFTLDGMYDESSEAYLVTEKIFDAFYRKALEDGELPIIVIFPDTNDQWRSRQKKPRRYTPLLDHFASSGYRVIDTLGAFEPVESRYSVKDLSVAWGHFSPLGNKLVAEYIYSHLSTWNLTDAAAVRAAMLAERQRLGIQVR
jgi:hypothetical protein